MKILLLSRCTSKRGRARMYMEHTPNDDPNPPLQGAEGVWRKIKTLKADSSVTISPKQPLKALIRVNGHQHMGRIGAAWVPMLCHSHQTMTKA